MYPPRDEPQPQPQPRGMRVFWQNKEKAQSADSFVLSVPGIALQEKQSHAFKLATQNGDPGKTDSITVIKREHDKFNPPCPHLFVFITDKRVGDDVKAQLDKCELVIDARNEQQFYGPFLARLKLFHDRNENVELDDPTEALRSSTGALRSWLASRSGSSTAVATVASAAASASVDSDGESTRSPNKRRTSASIQTHRPSSEMGSRKRRRGSAGSSSL